jgi:uncharacterized spore protein YtfJ
MEADVERLLDMLADLRRKANVNACFGEPVTLEDRTVIPVARVGYGFGVSLGSEPAGEGGEGWVEKMDGGGVGMTASPLAVVEVTPQGTRVEPVVDRERVAIASALVGAWSLFWVARALAAIFGRRA